MPTQDATSAVGADLDLTTGDFEFTGYGDLQMLAGLNLVEQRIYLRCLPEPGGLVLHPEAGAGVGAAVDQPFTPNSQATVAANVAAQMQQDPAIQAVQDVQVTTPRRGELNINPVATLIGGLTTELSLPPITGSGSGV